jgi:hypothetical protein
MLKVKNLFMMALLTVAVGLFVPACVEDEPEKEYTISVIGGTMWTEAGDTLDNGVVLPVGDVVIIRATPQDGKVFDVWQVSPSSAISAFYDKDSSYTTFRMPDGANVTITAKFKTPDIEEPEGFTISVEGGEMWLEETNAPLNNGDILYEEDVVIILSAEPASDDEEFLRWDVVPADAVYYFEDRYDSETRFTMPDADVVITAVFGLKADYTISTIGGTMEWWENSDTPEEDPVTSPLSDGMSLYRNDVVIILSADPPEGKKEFDRWDVVPASAAGSFNDRYNPNTTFRMPAADVVITAVFKDFEPGKAEVRFTWEAAEAANIEHISVDSADVAWWYADVFGDPENVPEDFTAIPLYDGNPSVKSIAAPYDATNEYKGQYFKTEAGSFTAVCGAKDEYGLAEIVANYTITVNPADATADGKDLYFEIAFDVGTFLSDDGTDDNAWFSEETEDPDQGPRLEKKKASKFSVTRVATRQYKKPGATVDVTYYVIRRPKV